MFGKALLLAFILSCIVVCSAEKKDQTGIRFQIFRNSTITVPVLVNGRGPYDFVLDTGTETSLIDSSLAMELGLKALDRLTLYSLNGQNNFVRVFVPRISLGSISKTNLEMLVDTTNSATALNPGFRGVIGQDFLAKFDFMLDYEHRLLSFFPPGSGKPPITGTLLPLKYLHNCPALTARAIDGQELRLLLDSGSSALALFSPEIPGFKGCGRFECRGTLTTAISASHVDWGVMAAISVGKKQLNNLPAFFLDPAPGERAMLVDGLLPTSFFEKVYFNNQEGYAIVGYSQQ